MIIPFNIMPLAIVQKNLNFYWANIQHGLNVRHRLTNGEIVTLALVIFFLDTAKSDTKLLKYCMNCRTKLTYDAKFCRTCGQQNQ